MTARQYVTMILLTALTTGSIVGVMVHLFGGDRYDVGMYAATFGVIALFVSLGIAGVEYQARKRKDRDDG